MSPASSINSSNDDRRQSNTPQGNSRTASPLNSSIGGSPDSRTGYEGGINGLEKWFNSNVEQLGVIQEVSIRSELNENDMSMRPLQEQTPANESSQIQRTKFRNPTISDMASSMKALSPEIRNSEDKAIIQFSEMGDDYYEVPDELVKDPRYFICTCNLQREELPCTCKFNDIQFNKAMYNLVTL